MNAHLNIYKAYSKLSRDGYQLEDDLTRALAITLQENDVFSHQFLHYILKKKEAVYENLFDNYIGKSPIEIDIQKHVGSIKDIEHLFAVRISGEPMGDDFFIQTADTNGNPITDLYIRIDTIAIIIEVKPANYNSTAQLYNQALNTIRGNESLTMEDNVTAVDFNWPLLMQLAVRVNNYQEAINRPSRLLDNFISYIKMHNYQWLPQLPLSALTYDKNSNSIKKRISDAIDNSENPPIGNRLGFKCNLGWAEEILINLDQNSDDIVFVVYPGNTKGQGWHIFKTPGEPQFKKEISINGHSRELYRAYHVKFSGQRYITGLWATNEDIKNSLFTTENFRQYAGRKKRDEWQEIEELLDSSFKPTYNWRNRCDWENKVLNTNYSQFNFSFGFELVFRVPYSELQELDTEKENLQPLISLFEEVKNEFKTILR